MWFIGLDAHTKQSTFCVLDGHGQRLKSQTVKGPWDKVLLALSLIKEPWAICFEASTGYGILAERLGAMAQRVVVAHPGQLRLIFRSKRKNDRVDAEKLAKLLYLNEVPAVHVPTLDVRAWRQLIEYRHRILGERTRVKNRLRAFVRGNGWTAPKGLWTRKGLAWLRSQPCTNALDLLRRDDGLAELESLTLRLKRLTRELDGRVRKHPGGQLVQTIPGVGPRTAEAVVAYMDDPRRFARVKQVASYFGLTPCQDASAEKNRLGHITRQGPATVRGLLVEATWQGIRRSPTLKAYFARIHQDKPERRKIALVATAHYLVRVMFTMLRTGECWQEGYAATSADPKQAFNNLGSVEQNKAEGLAEAKPSCPSSPGRSPPLPGTMEL